MKESLMPPRFRSALLVPAALVAGTLLAGSAIAQDTTKAAEPECNPNAVATQALSRATFSMQRAISNVQAKRDATKDLKDAIMLLTSPPSGDDRGKNDSTGRAYYLGQAYILLLQQPGITPIGRRGDFGIATDTSLTVDLLAAADTAFSKVEQADPACRIEMGKWRQQQPWLDALNGSISALNAEHFDSAEVLAKRSLIIDKSAPYAYSVLASVASHRKDYDAAINYSKKVIEIAGKDTAYADQGPNAMYDLANTLTQRAESTTGPEKKARVQEAVKAWQDFMPVGTRDLQVAGAVQMIKKLLKSANDTLSYQQAYTPIIADPAHYAESALLNAGLIAVSAHHAEDGIKLFSAVLDKNPYQRDALNNLAASYASAKQPEKMLPLIDRLVALDPNNADNWLLYAYAYSGLLKGTQDPTLKKTYTDSLIKFNAKSESISPRLALTAFSHNAKETSLSGTIENYVAKPKKSVSGKTLKGSATATGKTKTFTLTVEFLDAQGNVIGTPQTTTVGPVAPGGTESFTVTLPDQDAVAFRYTLS
jgi:tetratricopeptide (TPR) repeat protein